MDTRESNTAWIIAGILFVLLIVVGYLWLSAPKDVQAVLDEGYDNIAAQREELARACQSPEGTREDCEEELQDLSELLAEFSAEIDAATTSEASASTTVR